jgi:hypothetical protein
MDKNFSVFCGVDVSKEWIDVAMGKTVAQLSQNRKTIKAFIKKHFDEPSTSLVVLYPSDFKMRDRECFKP